MTKTVSEIMQQEKYMTLTESVQVIKALIKIIGKMHEAGCFVPVLFPDKIQIQEEKGEHRLIVDRSSFYSLYILPEQSDFEYQIAAVGFISPEVALKDYSRIGKQSDYYSVVALFYYCLTGRKISRFQMFRSGIPDFADVISRNNMSKNAVKILYRIFKKGLSPGLEKRYQSLEQLEKDVLCFEECVEADKENRHLRQDTI